MPEESALTLADVLRSGAEDDRLSFQTSVRALAASCEKENKQKRLTEQDQALSVGQQQEEEAQRARSLPVRLPW
jgi:hypothetical protein